MSEKVWLLIVGGGVVVGTLVMAYVQQTATSATVFVVAALIVSAVYLLRFGSLKSFRLEALSAKAELINEKAREAEAGAEEVQESLARIRQLEEDLQSAMELAKPPQLRYSSHTNANDQGGILVKIAMEKTKGAPIGPIVAAAQVPKSGSAEIRHFRPSKGVGPFVGGPHPDTEQDSKLKIFQLSPLAQVKAFELDVVVSEPSRLRLTANHEMEPIEVEVHDPQSTDQGTSG